MNNIIKNRGQILSYGDVKSKRIVLDITERTLFSLNAYHRIKSIMHLEGDLLHIGVKCWDISKKRNIYLIGAGKACNAMAMAVDEILGDRLTKGIAIVKVSEKSDVFYKTEVYVGGHPLPNEEGLRASKEILTLVDQSGKDDLYIVVISGGSSALMSYPIEGITLKEEAETTDILLKSGASILEINAIRRHISQMNGGMLAKRIKAVGAELIGIGISDSVGNPPTDNIAIPTTNYKGTPIGPDLTTLEDARRVIRDYDLANRLPLSVINYLNRCGSKGETPKSFSDNTYYLLNTLPDSCTYAKRIAEEIGISVVILTTFLEGESRDAGQFLASLAREIQTYHQPISPPCIVLCSGETTTRISDNNLIKGHGGPSQELVASFAIAAEKVPGVCILSIDTEGTDGTTDAAGGIADSKTYSYAYEKRVDLYSALRGHATYEALRPLEALVMTGNTGTNLCDLNIMYVPR